MTSEILIPFNGAWLALTPDQLREALGQGQALMGASTTTATAAPAEDKVLDAEGMERETAIPASWYLEQARQGKIPHIRAGKYVRFRLNEVLDTLKADPRHADRLSVHVPKPALNQRPTKGCYRVATKN
jgi:hypothetical protein